MTSTDNFWLQQCDWGAECGRSEKLSALRRRRLPLTLLLLGVGLLLPAVAPGFAMPPAGLSCATVDQEEMVFPVKLMQRKGMASRREAEYLIRSGRVLVDGEVHTEPGDKILATSTITLTGKSNQRQRHPTVLLHKPVGFQSAKGDRELELGQWASFELLLAKNRWRPRRKLTSEEKRSEERLALQVAKQPWHIAPCGRLDMDSRGLLLMSSDGVVASKLVGSKRNAKEYHVLCRPQLSDEQIARLNGPMMLDGDELMPMEVKRMEGSKYIYFRLHEGKNRQIRRVVDQVGSVVVDLVRMAIGGLQLGSLPEGRWRLVLEEELRTGLI
eukprot:TRINITY_DN63762_c0_g1_i2.p1 TRINITY_DN63762_c0_g1~~TRINITY_DN63762_c0_g1_i2.p1  ORF type:complete len:328 (-),score=70.75 TRINITY_DN63762_c0_g1_i2:614-1597(-)